MHGIIAWINNFENPRGIKKKQIFKEKKRVHSNNYGKVQDIILKCEWNEWKYMTYSRQGNRNRL